MCTFWSVFSSDELHDPQTPIVIMHCKTVVQIGGYPQNDYHHKILCSVPSIDIFLTLHIFPTILVLWGQDKDVDISFDTTFPLPPSLPNTDYVSNLVGILWRFVHQILTQQSSCSAKQRFFPLVFCSCAWSRFPTCTVYPCLTPAIDLWFAEDVVIPLSPLFTEDLFESGERESAGARNRGGSGGKREKLAVFYALKIVLFIFCYYFYALQT